jgi:outer membrane protein assembly factor BamB
MVARSEPPSHLSRRLVAAGDRVYVTLGFNAPVTALDAATGETVRVYDRTEHATEIVYKEGLLFLAAGEGHLAHGQGEKLPPLTTHIMALRAETGEILWENGDYFGVSGTRNEKGRITRVALTVGNKHAFFLDRGDVAALDLETGEECWRAERPRHPELKLWTHYHQPLHRCTLVYQDGVVLMAQPRMGQDHVPYTALRCELLALSADTGETLWERECYNWTYGFPPDLFAIDGLVWIHDAKPYTMVGVDLATGKEMKRFPTTEALEMTHHHSYYREKATERFILAARRGTEFLDVGSGENILHHWVRGTCFMGIMPANGLLYAPPHPCVCYITAKLNGLHALAPERVDATEEENPHSTYRLERGPAYGSDVKDIKGEPGPVGQWPTYRHDTRRSGATQCPVPATLEQKWAAEIDGTPSSPVAANGKIFVASTDTHCVYALDAQNGDTLWDYTAGGKIDTPPTVYGGRVLFGSADGWVYCLRASDGNPVWRLRAAPVERQVVDHGQLASAWPLHGSVLVHNGVAYVCAGRSSFLDGGVYVLALDPATGEVLQRERIYSPEPDTGEMAHCELPYDMPPDKPGALSDILLTDGETVYLRHLRFNPADLSEYRLAGGAELLSKAQRYIKTRKNPKDRYYIGTHPGLGPQLISNSGLLDDTWYNQSFWTVGGQGHSRLLVFDADTIYGVRAYQGTRRHARDTFVHGEKGYKLFAMDRKTGNQRWAKQVPVRIRAMVLADATLFAAGPPDVVPEDDPWAAFEGRKGAELWAFSAGDGRKLAEEKLPSPPVLDGMIAAGRHLYVSTTDGRLTCMGGE